MSGRKLLDSPRIDFLIAGAQKAGTTALAQYLSQNPDIYIPAKKELHWFRRHIGFDGTLKDLPIKKYHRNFEGEIGRRICGEASPIYLYWPRCFDLIQQYRADMRLIVTLRNPVLRAYSAWSMERRRGREHLDFMTAITTGRKRVADAPGGFQPVYSYVERGFYAQQIAGIFNHFDRRQVFFLRADEISSDGLLLPRLEAFLGAGAHGYGAITANVMPSSLPAEPDALARAFALLFELYLPDLKQLTALTGLDVSDWIEKPPALGL